jgi:oligopeptide/dipeptide ABC transporter ATP-binding protein
MDTLLEISNLSLKYRKNGNAFDQKAYFYALKNISLAIGKNETFCIIGESGSGKTTLLNAIFGFAESCEGLITYRNMVVNGKQTDLRKHAQIIFQNYKSSLNPYLPIKKSLEEPLLAKRVPRVQRREIIHKTITLTGLKPELLERCPDQLSGGQNQRVCFARAISARPEILFLDEPFSGLDGITAQKIAGLLEAVKDEGALTLFMITHNIIFAKKHSEKIAVMFLGRLVESASTEEFFDNPLHPYSRVLLSNVLSPGLWNGERIILSGEKPSIQNPPRGCPFHPLCPERKEICGSKEPATIKISGNHSITCHLYSSGSRC